MSREEEEEDGKEEKVYRNMNTNNDKGVCDVSM